MNVPSRKGRWRNPPESSLQVMFLTKKVHFGTHPESEEDYCIKPPSVKTPSRSLENDGLEPLLPEPSSKKSGAPCNLRGADNGPIVPKASRDEIGLVTGSRLDPPRMEEGTLWLQRRLRGGSSRFFPPEPPAGSVNRPRKGSPERGIRGTALLNDLDRDVFGSAPDPRPRSKSIENLAPIRFSREGRFSPVSGILLSKLCCPLKRSYRQFQFRYRCHHLPPFGQSIPHPRISPALEAPGDLPDPRDRIPGLPDLDQGALRGGSNMINDDRRMRVSLE